MPLADPSTYLERLVKELNTPWPENRTVNIVCHGHSVPSGYFMTPLVDTFNAYPHLLHHGLKHRFPYAVINVIVTGKGGESADKGSERFEKEVLCHRPDVLTIDYSLNDRAMGLDNARVAWVSMIERALANDIKIILLTPTSDTTQKKGASTREKKPLKKHADQVRKLADEYGLGLADSLSAFQRYQEHADWSDLMSSGNHPNRKGHEMVAQELLRWFPVA